MEFQKLYEAIQQARPVSDRHADGVWQHRHGGCAIETRVLVTLPETANADDITASLLETGKRCRARLKTRCRRTGSGVRTYSAGVRAVRSRNVSRRQRAA